MNALLLKPRKPPLPPRAELKQTGFAALFFLAATIVLTWPIAAHIDNGLADLWDAKLNAWILHWDYHQTFRDPAHLFDANIFSPARLTLAFSENLFGAAVFGFPLYAAGVSTLAVYNVVFLLGMFFSAMAAWALARYVTEDAAASLLAGLIYAFVPWRLAQIPHFQFQWGGFLALCLLFLLKYLDHGRRRDQAFFALFFAWNAAANIHYAIFSALMVGLVLAYEAVARPSVVIARRVWGSLLAAAVAGLAVIPLFVPYAIVSDLYGMQRGDSEIEFFSGHPIDFLTAGWQNKTYGPLTQKWGHPEGDFFPGLVALGLTAAALARRRDQPPGGARRSAGRRRWLTRPLDVSIAILLAAGILAMVHPRETFGPFHMRDPGRILVFLTVAVVLRLALAFPARSRFANLGDFLRRMRLETRKGLFLAIAALGAAVALGMRTPYYRFLVESFGPIFRAIRAPSRGIVLFDLGLAVLAAWGLSRVPFRRAVIAAAIVVTAWEYRAFPVRVDRVESQPPAVDRWLAGMAMPGSVVAWPFATGDDVEYQFRSTAHWKPLVNGYSGFFPPDHWELAAMFEKKSVLQNKAIRPEVWSALEKRDCRLLILHPHEIPGEPLRRAYLATLQEALRTNRIRPMKAFPHGDSSDIVFELRRGDSTPTETSSQREASLEAGQALEMLMKALNPPFGFIDSPRDDEVVAAGASGYGWALDDSGVQNVLFSSDGAPPIPLGYGLPFPGVLRAYPGYPDAAHAGFGFTIPKLTPGRHVISLTIIARDGGRLQLSRSFFVR